MILQAENAELAIQPGWVWCVGYNVLPDLSPIQQVGQAVSTIHHLYVDLLNLLLTRLAG